ncbi:MAG: general secretion pathway protein GspK [Planctomycetes bacterium]|nr:general secretion pathway protein GspK [Planctomycetota bacterium]
MILTPPSAFRLPPSRRHGYVLIAVLVVIVVLSLAAYRFTDSMSGEHRAAVRTSDLAQARAAAVSGVHYAASMLSDPDAMANRLNGDPTLDNASEFGEVVVRDDPNRKACFRLVAVATTSPGVYEQRSAVIDEGAKLNINALIAQDKTGQVLYNALVKLPILANLAEGPAIADAIVDWVDADDTPRTSGAENSTYLSLANPYKCKNGPLNSIDELLLVQGVTPQLLYGNDQNQNGAGDDNNGQSLSRGLADFVTIYGREVSVDASGQQLKVYINGDDVNAIYTALQGSEIGSEIAAYIMAVKLFGPTATDANGVPTSKGAAATPVTVASSDQLTSAVETKLASTTSSGRAINSIIDLVNTRVTLPSTGGSGGKGGKQPTLVFNSPLNDPNKLKELLPNLLTKVATKEAVEVIPRLNVNHASRDVLLGLPGLTEADVDALIGAREGIVPGTAEFTSGAWMVTLGNLTPQKFKAIEKYVTGSSMMYRVQSIGYLANGGPVARVEAVIDTNLGYPRIVYFRDLGDLDAPRGFQPPATQK